MFSDVARNFLLCKKRENDNQTFLFGDGVETSIKYNYRF